MNRAIESRLQKLEQNQPGLHLTHEEWLEILDSEPAPTEAESAALDAKIEAEAIAQFGSLAAASSAASAKAARTKDPYDTIEAWSLEDLLQKREARDALA